MNNYSYSLQDSFDKGKNFLDGYVNNADNISSVNLQGAFNSFSEPLEQDYGEIAMTRGEARNILDRLTQEALRKNITPQAFASSLFEFQQIGSSPDYSRRLIRNALKTPAVRLAIENPELGKQALTLFGTDISQEGFNPNTALKNFDAAVTVLRQLKKDNLLKPNVTLQETKEEIQKPMYGALMDWTKSNLNNPQLQKILQSTPLKSNVQTWGLRGLIPISVGFSPDQFGVKLTPQAAKEQAAALKQKAWEASPEGRRELERQRQYADQFRRDQEAIQRALRR